MTRLPSSFLRGPGLLLASTRTSPPVIAYLPRAIKTTSSPVHSTASLHTSAPAMSSSSSSHSDRPAVLSELSPIYTSLHDAKVKKQMSFEQIAKAINRNEWYTAAIFYGQAKPDENDIKNLAKVMDIREEYLQQSMGPHFFPTRGLGQWPPKDPVVYRLYEALLVYGYPLKHLIHEKFGDGIMSLIDFYGDIERVPDPAGDRVKITFNGKFLPYKRW